MEIEDCCDEKAVCEGEDVSGSRGARGSSSNSGARGDESAGSCSRGSLGPMSMEDEPAPLKSVEFQKKCMMPEVIAREYAFTPEGAKQQLLLEAPAKRPPLIIDETKEQQAVYDMGPENAGRVIVDLRLRSADDDGESFDISLPLRMLPYKTPDDPKMCFDLPTCRRVDAMNETIENHNRYITSLLSIFVRENGCGTSANHVTLPSPPDVMGVTRIKRLEAVFKDRYSSTVLAVRYLSSRGKICGQDYDIEKAVEAADDFAFEAGVRDRIEKGKGRLRFRIQGSPWAFWSGRAEDRDSLNRRVQWKRGEHHSFLSPEIDVGMANNELISA